MYSAHKTEFDGIAMNTYLPEGLSAASTRTRVHVVASVHALVLPHVGDASEHALAEAAL